MDFEHSEEQRLLADSVRRFVENDYGFERRREIIASADGWSPEAWAALADMGLMSLALPSEYDGFDGGAVDLMATMETFGEGLVVEPFLPVVLAGRLILRAGSGAQKRELLPQVAAGALRLAVAHQERGVRFDLSHVRTTAQEAGGAWTITGTKAMVVGASMAERLVVSAQTPGGLALFLVDTRNVELKPYTTVDGVRVADAQFRSAKAERLGDGVGTLEILQEVNDLGTALVCAEAVGAMKYACDTTLEYLKTRKQFGVTIGSFQALQHRMVDMYIASEFSRSLMYLACSKIDSADDAAERGRAVSAAKIKVSDCAIRISQEAVQLHGGMGMSEELKISHTFRRLTVMAEQFGDAEYHLLRFASLDRDMPSYAAA